jgi:para-nitrobenzyl esterase
MRRKHLSNGIRNITAIIAAVAVVGLAGHTLAAPAKTVVAIDSGKIEGVVDGKVLSFKGIPFAAPPVGALRWRPPQPAAHWTGTRKADSYGNDCMQVPFPSDAAPLGTPPKEDCLYLNVWRPAEASAKPLPVMVWIYGGGYVNGGSSPAVYDGSAFARQGVIMVSFNYRLGRFGFFAFPALTKEAKAKGEDLGNYTYMDQIAALQWVQRNIAAFGGDPKNVTIFGESAGGDSVLRLLTIAEARGLFAKAVCESGGGRGSLLGGRKVAEKGPDGSPSAEDIGVAMAKSLGVDGTDAAALAALRAVPAEKILNGLNMATMGQARDTYVGGTILDGKIVTGSVEQLLKAGKAAPVPVMIGANSADLGFSFAKTKDEIFASFGDHADAARKLFDPDGNKDLKALAAEVAMERTMVEPARFVAATVATHGQPSYNYRFSYVAKSMRKEWAGAPHATEIPYVFDTVAAKYGDALAPADETTAKAANTYWVNFAKTGDPNGKGLPNWPRFDPKTDPIMDFTLNGPVGGPDPWKVQLDLIAKTAPSAN